MERPFKKLSANSAIAMVATILAMLLGAEFFIIRHLISRDRTEIERSFGQDRREQLSHAVERVESEMGDIIDDLFFARHLAGEDDPAEEREARLAALVGSIEPYRSVSVWRADGQRVLEINNQRDDAPESESVDRAILDTADRAMEAGLDEVVISGPSSEFDSVLEHHTLRVVATAVELPGSSELGAVTMVVNTDDLFSPLELVSSDAQSSLLVIADDGTIEPPTGSRVEDAMVDGTLPPIQELIERMEQGGVGSVRIDGEVIERLGFEDSGALGAYAPIRAADRTRWRVATLSSMSVLKEREQKTVGRLTIVSGAIGLLLLGFGGYVVVSIRRRTALTERLRVAHEIAHLNEKADKILESIPIGVLLVSEDRRATGFNQAVSDWLPGAEPGKSLAELFAQASPKDVARLETVIDDACAAEVTREFVDEHSSLFGDDGQYRIHVVPLEPSEPEERALVVIDDFSELHALEMQLLRAEKLATVGILAAGIAHEVGTPLGVVRGRAEYLQYKLDDDDPAADSLQIIVDQIDRVSRVIRGLLDFSREAPPTAGAVDVGRVAHQVAELLRYEFERNEICLDVDIAEDMPKLAADADSLQQVLINLLVNALDASEPGDHIGLSASYEPDDEVIIVVEDTGCGIPEDRIHQVFDPFFTTKKRGQGTGLGLPMVAKIVRNHGGQVDLDSEEGRGTTFTLRWPTSPKEVNTTQSEDRHDELTEV
ncbi:MAG: ATP-binding protein [Persicimonas sp.]